MTTTIPTLLFAALLQTGPWSHTQAPGPSLKTALNAPCHWDQSNTLGAFTTCDASGRVRSAALELDTWGSWQGSHHRICTEAGLKSFAGGAWTPDQLARASAPSRPAPMSRVMAEVVIDGLTWACSGCPHCRRPMLAVTVSDPARPTAPKSAWSLSLENAQKTVRAAIGKDLQPLLLSRNARVRAIAMTWLRSDPSADQLSKLLADTDPTVQRLALQRAVTKYDVRWLRHVQNGLRGADLGQARWMLHLLGREPRWLRHPRLRATVQSIANSYPEPKLRGLARRLCDRAI